MKNLKDTLKAMFILQSINETFEKYMKEGLVEDLGTCRILLEMAFGEDVENYYQETGTHIRKLVDSLDDEQICVIYNMIKAAVLRLYEKK